MDTTTGKLLEAVVAAIQRHAKTLDTVEDLRAVIIDVKMDAKTGDVGKVIVRPEMSH